MPAIKSHSAFHRSHLWCVTFIRLPPVCPGPDGSLRDGLALCCDSLTGLIRPNAGSHMLLSNGHIMAVPDDYFLHPHTGRLLPIAGNVAYDPVSSSLVFTTDLCAGTGGCGGREREQCALLLHRSSVARFRL